MSERGCTMHYTIDIAGLKRDLKLFPINDDLQIAAFILFGDVEVTKHAAEQLLKMAPDFDCILTAEAKSIPLAYEMAAQSGTGNYIIARKSVKVYMGEPLKVSVQSITTRGVQTLYLGQDDIEKIRGSRVLIVDDVISTGESLSAIEELVRRSGGNIVAKMAVLAEGDSFERDDITVLAKLPLFDGKGNPL